MTGPFSDVFIYCSLCLMPSVYTATSEERVSKQLANYEATATMLRQVFKSTCHSVAADQQPHLVQAEIVSIVKTARL